MPNLIHRLSNAWRNFRKAQLGNVVITFALAAVPLVTAVGAGVDYGSALKDRMGMQSALDSAALALVKSGSGLTQTQLNTAAQNWFNASFSESAVSGVSVTASYDSTALTATVNGSATYTTSVLGLAGVSTIPLSGTARAQMVGKRYEVCVMITSPNQNHTLKTDNTAQINFSNCMVQVNTQNWDAVEAGSTSSIHGTNSDMCLAGTADIHFGDVTPAKDASCTQFPDPFSGYTMPASASTCTYTHIQVTTNNTTLQPGTYCQGLQISNVANVTFAPGVYVISGGQLKMQGSGSTQLTASAPGVTFLLVGNGAGTAFTNVTLNQTPTTTGTFQGFLFFLDQTPAADGKTHYQSQAQWQNVTMSSNGIIYFVGQQFQIEKASNITLNTGAIEADYLLPKDTAIVNLTGATNASNSAELALQKSGSGNSPVLVN